MINIIRDGWKNLMTGLKGCKDKSSYTYLQYSNIIDDDTLTAIWTGDGPGKRIVECVADDMTRNGFTIKNDDELLITNEIERLRAEKELNTALKWQRLLAGAVIVMDIQDGGSLDEPVNLNKIKSIDSLRVFDRTAISILDAFFTMGEPESFEITPLIGNPFKIHNTRCLVFRGEPVPENTRDFGSTGNIWYWGMSALQTLWEDLQNLGSSKGHTINILQEFVINVYHLEGLKEAIASRNEEAFRTRMNAIDLQKSSINGVLLSKDENFQRITANVAGLADLLDKYMIFLAGSSGIPVTKLFGRSAAGMNATGEGDQKNYDALVRAKQKYDYKPALQKLVKYINASLNNKVQDPIIEFNPLQQETLKELIELKKIQFDIDDGYTGNGVLETEEVRTSRFANGYSFETKLMEDK